MPSTFKSLVCGGIPTGDFQVIALDPNGQPYVVSYVSANSDAGWQAGSALPCPSQQGTFSSLTKGISRGAFQVWASMRGAPPMS